jgi:DHA1 family tetracycline resistance protein-like MFS transporter
LDGIPQNEEERFSESTDLMTRSPLFSIFLIVLVDVLGLTIILPLLPFYAESFGATPAVVGMLVSTYAICQLIAGPPLGHLSDRVGRRPVLLVSQIGTCVGFLILASASSLWMVFLARVIDGLTAGNLTVAQAYISDVTEPENRAKSFAMIGIAFGLGFLVGPAVSGYLAQFSNVYPILAAAGLSFTSIMCTYFLLAPVTPHAAPETEGGRGSRRAAYIESFKDGQLAPMLWQFFAFTLAFSTLYSGFALFAERRFTHNGMPFGPKEVGYVFAFSGLIGALIQGGGIGSLVKTFGESRLVQMGFATMALGFALLSEASQLLYLLIAITFLTFGSAILRPSLTSLITTRAARHRQGMVIGLMQSLMSVAQIVAPVVAGFLIQKQYLTIWALVGSAFCVVGWSLIAAMR